MFNFSHTFLLYIVLRILSCHHISFSLHVFFFPGFSWFFFWRFKSSSILLTIAPFLINIYGTLGIDSAVEIAIESIESSGKHCNKLILHNFPMSAMFQRTVVPELDKLSFSSLLYESNIYMESVSQLRPKM